MGKKHPALFAARPVVPTVFLTLPVQVLYRAIPANWRVTRSGSEDDPTFQWWEEGDSDEYLIADAKSLREEFFAVKSPRQLEAFLGRCGPFRTDDISVTWKLFGKWQDYFRKQRVLERGWGTPPQHRDHEVLRRVVGEPRIRTYPVKIERGRRQNHLLIECESVVEAIAAVNYVDNRNQVKTRTCRTCGRLFTPLTKRAKTCGRKCTHRNWRKSSGRIDGKA